MAPSPALQVYPAWSQRSQWLCTSPAKAQGGDSRIKITRAWSRHFEGWSRKVCARSICPWWSVWVCKSRLRYQRRVQWAWAFFCCFPYVPRILITNLVCTDHRRCSWERPYGKLLCVYVGNLPDLMITFVCIQHQLWMPRSDRSTVIEIFDPPCESLLCCDAIVDWFGSGQLIRSIMRCCREIWVTGYAHFI